jgi:predicted outer membrane repeat protein
MLLSLRLPSLLLLAVLAIGSATARSYAAPSDCNENGIEDLCDLRCGPPGHQCDVEGCGMSEDCNRNVRPDECDIDSGYSNDCNRNGIPDECDLARGESRDCDDDGIPDECQEECNDNDVPDICDIKEFLSIASPRFAPVDRDHPQTWVIPQPRRAYEPVALLFTARGDFARSDEYVEVDINGVVVGRVLEEGDECRDPPNGELLVVGVKKFNDAIASGEARIRMTPSAGVEPLDCSYIEVRLYYQAVGASGDCNYNETPDECDINDGTSPDDNGNGIPDECEANRLFVRQAASGMNNGIDWENAYTELRAALATYVGSGGVPSETWVAEGIYAPEKPGGSRHSTFQLYNGLALYGGFDGTEQHREDRAPGVHHTRLTGDLNGDDEFQGFQDNVYHVVSAVEVDGTAKIDGFVIQGGRAENGEFDDTYGGGMRIVAASPVVRACRFEGNVSERSGAGVHCDEQSRPTILDSLFRRNIGSAVSNAGGAPYISACVFIENEGQGAGFRTVNTNYSEDPVLSGCLFLNNSADLGGGIAASASSPYVYNCSFLGNEASGGGGASLSSSSRATFVNCLFSGNSASSGGAISHAQAGTTVVIACTFSGNTATRYGGGISEAEDIVVTNSILWGNRVGEEHGETAQLHYRAYPPAVDYCDIEGWTGGLGGVGNLGADPLFVDADGSDDIPGTPDDDLRLLPGSPCFDAGDSEALPADRADLDGDGNTVEPIPHDLGGNPRAVNTLAAPDFGRGTPPVDIGAYEDTDCNGNGVDDRADIADGFSADCDDNRVPDECDADCDHDGRPDGCEADCDGNGTPDDCEWVSTGYRVAYVLEGAAAADLFGYSLASIDDVDGDGRTDLVIGAAQENGNRGASYLYALHPTSARLLSKVEGAGGWYGITAAAVGDANGDGVADYAIGAHRELGDEGTVRVLSGADRQVGGSVENHPAVIRRIMRPGEFTGKQIGGIPERSQLLVAMDAGDGHAYVIDATDGSDVAHLTGSQAPRVWISAQGSICPVADLVGGDGVPDFVVVEQGYLHGTGGAVFLMDGTIRTSGPARIVDQAARTFVGPQPNEWIGQSTGSPTIAPLSDVSGDGIPDILIAAGRSTAQGEESGSVLGYDGATGDVLFRIDGESRSHFGASVLGLGDVDRDGYGDFLVSASGVSVFNTKGYVSIVSGRQLQELQRITDDLLLFGAALTSVGDVDGDGREDFAVSSTQWQGSRGRVYIYASGRPEVPGDFDLDGLVTFADYGSFYECRTGPCEGALCDPPLYADGCCAIGDFERDGDVDLVDALNFQVALESEEP